MKLTPKILFPYLIFVLMFPQIGGAEDSEAPLKSEPITGDVTEFTYEAPSRTIGGSGEYVHGRGKGKLLIRVMMLGAVGSQGIHYFPEETTLLDAILYSGGISIETDLADITIRRKGVQELIEIDLDARMEYGEDIPVLVDGDVINVDWNWRKDVSNFTFITGVISSVTAFTLSVIALAN